MTNGEQEYERMPVTLRVAFPALITVTALVFWEFWVGLAALALTTAAVVLIFLPSSRPYFGSGTPQSSGWKPISQRMP
ncbi:hypothetical protein [Microbacterium maritypicum]|uniref:hypothetical protein n=1 Tax=Microbacterium maritypicum TaxID=33918 RepID=UPI003A92C2C8